ncbi:MAG: hypothetical protein ACRDS9_06675 [Pseudonocardiaceae bacterium]
MTSGFKVDPALMETMAGTLRNAGLALDSAGNGAPTAPDAGDVTADIAALIGHLTNSAGELVVGVTAAGDAIARGGEDYLEAEDSGHQSFGDLR